MNTKTKHFTATAPMTGLTLIFLVNAVRAVTYPPCGDLAPSGPCIERHMRSLWAPLVGAPDGELVTFVGSDSPRASMALAISAPLTPDARVT